MTTALNRFTTDRSSSSVPQHGPSSRTAARVTVVIPAFNCGAEVVDAVACAINQQDVHTDVIIVDDGSTDRQTAVTLDQLQDVYDDRLTIVHQQNQGPAAARNAAIERAGTDWIAFLDHDDRWAADKLQRQLQAADRHSADVVLTAAENFDSVDRVDRIRGVPDFQDASDVFSALLMDNFVTLSSVLVRRECLQQTGLFDAQWKGVEDWALWLQMAADGYQFAAVAEPLVRYRWHATSLSHNHDAMQKQRRALIRQTLATAAGLRLSRRTRQEILANERMCSAWFMAESSPCRASILYLQALLHRPFHGAAWKGLLKSCLCCR